VRVLSIGVRLREWEITLDWRIGSLWLRLSRLIMGLILWLSGCACLWWLIYEVEKSPLSWPYLDAPYNNLTYASFWQQYVASMYFISVVFTTVGYGDFVARTVGERAFVIVFVLCNVAVSAYALANVVSWLQVRWGQLLFSVIKRFVQGSEKRRTDLADKLTLIKKYGRYRELDPAIVAKVI
jgi:hypothetical protein